MPVRTQPPNVDPRFIYLAPSVSNNDLSGDILSIPFPSLYLRAAPDHAERQEL